MAPLVSVLVLNHKQSSYVPRCLDALLQQTCTELEIVFIDNASDDGIVDYVTAKYPTIRLIANGANLYFSKAHNAAIKQSSGKYVMPLNVDVIVSPTYIEQMVHAMELESKIGMVSGKLLQMDANLNPLDPPMIDSTGLWFTPELRHFDRGSQEKDEGQYGSIEHIVGPSGAAALYSREMLEDVAWQGEYFDEEFVIYREDADLVWRAQWLGWNAVYTPLAVAWHVRRVRNTDSRRSTPALLRMHSVKNRFLMRIKNQSSSNAFRFLIPVLWRDLQVIAYVMLLEPSSLSAFVRVIRLLPRLLMKRKDLMARKRVSDSYIDRWFSYKPVAFPLRVSDH